MLESRLSDSTKRFLADAGLLVARLAVGAMMLFGHGLGKLGKLGGDSVSFPDPLGVGAVASLLLAILGEAVCSGLVILGLFTRAAAVPLLITMLVAALIVHGGDPWQKKELALLYAVFAVTLMFTGPGRFSMDARMRR